MYGVTKFPEGIGGTYTLYRLTIHRVSDPPTKKHYWRIEDGINWP